jgi:hypothetical protein
MRGGCRGIEDEKSEVLTEVCNDIQARSYFDKT